MKLGPTIQNTIMLFWQVTNYSICIFFWLFNFSQSNEDLNESSEKLAKLEDNFIRNFGAQGRLSWDQIEPIRFDSKKLSDICDNAHIQAGKGHIDLRGSRIINATLRFRNPIYGEKEIDALKCKPKPIISSEQSIAIHFYNEEANANAKIPRRPSINPNRVDNFGLDTLERNLRTQREKKILEEKGTTISEKEVDQGKDNLDTNVMIGRKPSINSNRKINFGFDTARISSKNQKEEKIVEEKSKNNFTAKVDQREENLEQKMNKKKGNGNAENIELNFTNQQGKDYEKNVEHRQNKTNIEETAAHRMGDSHDERQGTLRNRRGRGNFRPGMELTTDETTETIELVIDQKRTNETVAIDSNVKHQEEKNKEQMNSGDANFNQRGKKRDPFDRASSSSTNSDEIVDPDTNEFYLTQGLREECVFYLHPLVDKPEGAFYENVSIVGHVCGLIIPPL